MAGNFFRGTTASQDSRWGDADKKTLQKLSKAGKFDPILDKTIDVSKVNMDIISRWVNEQLLDILGFEDDVVAGLVLNMLQAGQEVDGKKLQMSLMGFLDKNTGKFVTALWTLLVDAQDSPLGVPKAFIEKKKEEILNKHKNTPASEVIEEKINDDGKDPVRKSKWDKRERREEDDSDRRTYESRSTTTRRSNDDNNSYRRHSDSSSYKRKHDDKEYDRRSKR